MPETILEILTRSITRVSIRSLRSRDYLRCLVSEPEKQTCVYSVFKILTWKSLQFQNRISRVAVLKSKFSFLYINNQRIYLNFCILIHHYLQDGILYIQYLKTKLYQSHTKSLSYVRHTVYITEKRQIIVEILEELIENHLKTQN